MALLSEQSKVYLDGEFWSMRISLPAEDVIYLAHYAVCLKQELIHS